MKRKYNPLLVGIIIAIVVFIYMAGPIDFLPDFISGFGQIDDGLVLLLGLIAEIANVFLGMNLAPARETANEQKETYAEQAYGEYREI